MSKNSNITLPWAAWHEDAQKPCPLPENWDVRTFAMADAPALTRGQREAAFANPIGCGTVAQLCAGKKTVAIGVDDLSRPTPAWQVLEILLQEIAEAGIARENVTIVISLGAHTALGREQLAMKLGENVVANYRVVNHDCKGDLTPCGALMGKKEVRINSHFLAADIKMLIGSVVPHHFAGFSGGAKMILPGLSNIEAIAWTHKAVLMGLRGHPGQMDNNRFRVEFERVARHIGVDFSVNVVVNGQREIAGLFAGDIVEAHREGAAFAKTVYNSEKTENLDIGIFNCYPKDTELIQAENAFMYLHSAGIEAVKEGGTVVVASACSEGVGEHGLFEPGALLYRKPVKKAFLKNRHLIFFSENLTREQFDQIYWEGYDFCATWDEVVQTLKSRHGEGCRVGVFPCASIQIVE